MLEFVLFVISLVMLECVLYILPKSSRVLNGIQWIIMNLVFTITIWIIAAGVMGLIGVAINLTGFAVVNLLIALAGGMYIVLTKKIQQYRFYWVDAVMIIIFIIASAFLCICRFGKDFSVFAYNSDDAARHYEAVRNLIEYGYIPAGRLAIYVFDGIIGMCMKTWLHGFEMYKVLEIGDGILLFLAGSVFYSWLVAWRKQKRNTIWIILFSMLYFLGYPISNMLYGFEYLGLGVMFINFLILLIDSFEKEGISRWGEIVSLTLVNVAVCLSYTLFAPAVLLGEFLYYGLRLREEQKIVSLETVMIIFGAYIIPGILCVCFVAREMMESVMESMTKLGIAFLLLIILVGILLMIQAKVRRKSVAENIHTYELFLIRHKKIRLLLDIVLVVVVLFLVYKIPYQLLLRYLANGVLAQDGSIYRNPYGDFLIWFFPMGICIGKLIKERKNDISLWLLIVFTGYSVWMVRYILIGVIGSYYFYKMQFVLWALVLGLACRGVIGLLTEQYKLMRTYLVGAFALIIVAITGVEHKFNAQNYFMWPRMVLDDIVGIYIHNLGQLENGGNLDQDAMDVLSIVYDLAQEDNGYIPIFGKDVTYIQDYYYILTYQSRYEHPHWFFDRMYVQQDIVNELKKMGYEYICELSNYEPDGLYVEEFNRMEVVFENDYARVLRLPDVEVY